MNLNIEAIHTIRLIQFGSTSDLGSLWESVQIDLNLHSPGVHIQINFDLFVNSWQILLSWNGEAFFAVFKAYNI